MATDGEYVRILPKFKISFQDLSLYIINQKMVWDVLKHNQH